jgi:cobalt-zinc-cadmium efflux system membrane fusion protein
MLAACGESRQPADAKTATTSQPGSPSGGAPAAAAEDPMLVNVKPEMLERFKAQAVASHELASVQEVAGRIEANEQKLTRIGAAVTGRVVDVLVDVGDRVSRGQAMAQVSSPELSQAQLAYLRAHANRELAERAEDRAQQLLRADVIGSAELQRRQSELAIATAELKAAADQLQLMGVPADAVARLRQQGNLVSQAAVTSTLAGTVIERKVSQGQVAQPGDPLFTVADLTRVWVVGGLPEQTARAVQVGQQVEVQVPALGQQQRWTGRIVFVGDTVNPETRTVAIRTEVENTGRSLKPQMLATMRISAAAEKTLAIPQTAVVREQDKDHVYVEEKAGQYRLTPVRLQPAVNGLRPVSEGLREGQRVVVEGAFHLNNERKRAELE